MTFQFDSKDNAWTAPDITLTGDAVLKLSLPSNGRLAIRKSNTGERFPIVLMSPWTGPDFYVRIHGETKGKIIRIQTTEMPVKAVLVNI